MNTDRDKLTFTFSLLKQQKGQFASNDQSDRVVGSRSGDEERNQYIDLHLKKEISSNDLFIPICLWPITMRQSYLKAWRDVPKSLLFGTCSLAF